ncbi:hypothetical protein [Rufibacter sp. LB8]|uniref:hypothetical protein n=1 Tax=Rufibacter sp. LB8 TaxID=2777781 RepID=UPI00178C3AC5|nr:hypothetical protein [Rufibacter sp. LB8]
MKKLLLIAVVCIFTLSGIYAQEKKTDQSKADLFSAKSGTLIEKEFLDVGKVKGVEVQVIVLKDLIHAAKTSAVRFAAVTGSGYSAGTKIGSVDADELEGLIKSIKLIQSSLLPSSPANYTEVSFTSRGGFEAGCYYSQDKKKWSAYLKLSKFDSNSMVFMSPEELVQVLALLELAKAKLV